MCRIMPPVRLHHGAAAPCTCIEPISTASRNQQESSLRSQGTGQEAGDQISPPAGLQANAVSDKLLDLRKCKLPGANLSGKTLSGGIFVDADLSGSNLREAVFSKAYAVKSNFKGELRPWRPTASL
jgi:Pentapeptide repeats (8 copies)